MLQQQILLMQNPCTDLEGPLQGHSVQRQHRQEKFYDSIFKLFTDCKTTKLAVIIKNDITTGSYITHTNILRDKNKYC
jgi:hypothetical protein